MKGGIIMTYNSKRTITSMVTGTILFVVYLIYAIQKHAQGVSDVQSWALSMLIFVGIGVVAAIVIQFVFHLVFAIGVAVKEREQSDKEVEHIIAASVVEDERDKLINLRASHIGYILAGIGFIAALASLAFGASIILGLHILFAAFAVGSMIEGIVSVYLYERGVRNA